jgi:hypothetical protein
MNIGLPVIHERINEFSSHYVIPLMGADTEVGSTGWKYRTGSDPAAERL